MQNKSKYIGIGLALLAVIIWSGNFIAARGVIRQIPPAGLAFYRWVSATVILLPFVWTRTRREWPIIRKHLPYFFWTSLAGVTLFNTFVYVGAHFTTAINLALIGTTSSPIIAIILARIFLKERLDILKIAGVAICVMGVLFLLSKGDWHNLVGFRFTEGDGWILLAATCFAVYNTMVKKKPLGVSSGSFLLVTFVMGTLLLAPYFVWESMHHPPVAWNGDLLLIVLYLGLGASIISLLCWNYAISKLGAGRTALFGNLIPIFSSIEAAILLHEEFTWVHTVSMVIVFLGILLANWRILRKDAA